MARSSPTRCPRRESVAGDVMNDVGPPEDLVDMALADALAPVLRDLENSGSVVPDIHDNQWSDFEGQVMAMLYGPDGSGQGVSTMTTEPERVASVADQVQVWAVEQLCSIGQPTNWPPYPQHPDSHPLSVVVRNGRAVWNCPKTGHVVSEIGQLPS
jgi:hypothetical protein